MGPLDLPPESDGSVYSGMLHNAGEYGTNKTYLTSLNFGPLLWYRGGQKLKGVQL